MKRLSENLVIDYLKMKKSKMKLFNLITLSLLFLGVNLYSQNDTPSKTTIQPTIMVIPFVPKGESLREKLEKDNSVLVAVTKVKEGFDNRGVNTIDLIAKLKQVSNTEILEDEAYTSEVDEVIKMSGADIYVEVQSKKNHSSSGNSVSLVLTAYDAFSSQSLANKVENSPSFYTENFDKLTEKAVETVIDDFLNVIQQRFNNILENGRSMIITFGINPESEVNFNNEYNDSSDLFSDLIEEWIEKNSYKNYYHLQGTSKTKMIFDDVRIPVMVNGESYKLSAFVKSLRTYLNSLGLKFDRNIQGNNVVITFK